MKVLGIDTSTMCGSIGFIDEEHDILFEYHLKAPITHSERLLKSIDHILNEIKYSLESIDGWAISLGPGSFTGLRIGVSTIKGLAFASNKPICGASSLDILANQISPTPYLICPIIDAKKGELYTAFYQYTEENLLERISSYEAISPEELVKRVERKTIFIGDGVKVYGRILKESLQSFALFPPFPLHNPLGTTVAKLGCDLLRSGKILDLETFTPIYVRPSEAEIKWQEKHPV